jgi:hypothetical protein
MKGVRNLMYFILSLSKKKTKEHPPYEYVTTQHVG